MSWFCGCPLVGGTLLYAFLSLLFAAVAIALYSRAKWASLVKSVVANIENKEKSVELFDKYMKGFLWERGKLSNFSPETAYRIYKHKNRINDLIEDIGPNIEYNAKLLPLLIKDKYYEIAYQICTKYGITNFPADTVFQIYEGLNSFDNLSNENIPLDWRLRFAEQLSLLCENGNMV